MVVLSIDGYFGIPPPRAYRFVMKTVRVHQFGDPSVLTCEQVADPSPGPDQIVVRTQAIGVNPVDTYIRAGIYGAKTFPYTPGMDAAGVVEIVGSNITTVQINQRVYTFGAIDGAYSEKVLCSNTQVFALPDRLTFDQGAAIGVPFGTAYRALFLRGDARPGETVLIHGASGGVGTAAIQLALNHGCQVIGTAGGLDGMKLVKSLGANLVLDHNSDNYIQQLMDFTAARGVNLIVEFLANKNLDKDLGLLAKRGRVVVVGSRGKIEIDPRQTLARDADIRGMSLSNADSSEVTLIHKALAPGFANGWITPIVKNHFALSDAAKAHIAVMEPGSHGKIILRP